MGRAVLVRTTCVGGVPCIGDPRVVRRVVHHATVVPVEALDFDARVC